MSPSTKFPTAPQNRGNRYFAAQKHSSDGSHAMSSDDKANADNLAIETVMAYHERSKHHLDRYAPGPETLDWDAQPNPFREFSGSRRCALPLLMDEIDITFQDLSVAKTQPMNLATIAQMLELSFGLAAWKEYGPDRWALRCNPSSGNLHPTEVYVLCFAANGLPDGLHHYLSRDHLLEQRWQPGTAQQDPAPALFIALSTIAWREAWKYGERAFRYCQLDVGHALGALRYAAATLGWRLHMRLDINESQLRSLLGLDRNADFADAEKEEAELLLEILPNEGPPSPISRLVNVPGTWQGHANRLDPHPQYDWPIIAETFRASRTPAMEPIPLHPAPWPLRIAPGQLSASALIRQRRSAQRFEPKASMPAHDFFTLIDALLPRATLPWDFWPLPTNLHPLFFVHRVQGLRPGLYAMPRSACGEDALRRSMKQEFLWQSVPSAPEHVPLWLLFPGDLRRIARTLSCHQSIAADSCFTVVILAEYARVVNSGAWNYARNYQEAGLLGQVLYLEAEALQYNGTGIGCFFDDAVHEILGIQDHLLQSFYHFTVGRALTDTRISTLPAYAERRNLGLQEKIYEHSFLSAN